MSGPRIVGPCSVASLALAASVLALSACDKAFAPGTATRATRDRKAGEELAQSEEAGRGSAQGAGKPQPGPARQTQDHRDGRGSRLHRGRGLGRMAGLRQPHGRRADEARPRIPGSRTILKARATPSTTQSPSSRIMPRPGTAARSCSSTTASMTRRSPISKPR